MDNLITNILDETKIILALSYKNDDIIKKFCSEHRIDYSLAEEYFSELKKFLYLCSNSNETLAPSQEIDKIWHTFILFTKEYRLYCLNYLGKLVDHAPQVNKPTSSSENYLINTINIYEYVFGELKNNIWQIDFYNNRDDDPKEQINYESPSDDYIHSESSKRSCVFTGDCYSCNGRNCVGENPNDL